MDGDVIIVGAGPTGLMLAVELRLAGVRPLVLERHPQIRDVPKAGGLGGQILEVLRYRGLLERFETARSAPSPALRLPFGGVHVDLTRLADPPMELLMLPQPQLERLLGELAGELGAEIRRGHEVVGLSQDDAAVTADVRGPDGTYQVTARYLVGCDGARSRVRDLADIPFPGTTFPEIQRLGQTTMPESVALLENGDLEVAGVGRIPFGFTPTERGVFATGSTDPALLGVYTSEQESADYDDDEPMTLTELRDSIRRVLGVDLPLGEPTRLTRFTYHARHVERYRDGRILLAGDAAHLFPAGGVALNAGMIDSVNLGWKLAAEIHGWAPAGLLDTYHDERRLAAERTLLHTRAQWALRRGHDPAAEALRRALSGTRHRRAATAPHRRPHRRHRRPLPEPEPQPPRPDRHLRTQPHRCTPTRPQPPLPSSRTPSDPCSSTSPTAQTSARRRETGGIASTSTRPSTDDRPADALLIRPDAYIAWAATIDEPTDTAAVALREALSYWFGEPA